MAKITVIGDDGQTAEINEENLGVAQERGLRPLSADEQQARADKAEYGEGIGNEIKAGLAGAARGATFGLSDVIGADFGKDESLRKLQEQNPTASTVGEVAGAVAPALLSGGETAVASGARLAGSGVRAVEAAGGLAERGAVGLAKALGVTEESSLLARTIAIGATKATGGAVQGAAYGAGQAISEAALQDKELTAEQLVQHMGAGALLGGVTGGAIGIGGKLAGAAAGKVASIAEGGFSKLQDVLKGSGDVRSKIAKASSLISGHDESVIAEFANDTAKVHIAENAEQHLDTAARKTAAAEDELRGIMDDIVEAGTGEGKRMGLRTKVNPNNIEQAATTTQDVITGARARVDHMLTNPDEFTNRGAVKAMDREVRKIEDFLANNDHGASGSRVKLEHVNAELYHRVDGFKRESQKIAKAARKSRMMAGDQATFDAINDMQGGVLQHLENEKIWGEAARTQSAVNKAWTNYLGNEKYAGANLTKKVGESQFESLYQTDPDKVLAAFKRVGTAGGDTLDAAYFANKSEFRKKLLEELQSHYGSEPGLYEKLGKAQKLTREIDDTFAGVRHINDISNKWQSLSADNGVGGVLPGAAVGGLFGGAPGAFIGGGIGKALGSPQATLKQIANAQAFGARMKSMSAVTDAARKASDKITGAIDGLIGGTKKGASAAALKAPATATIIDKPGATYLRPAQKGEDPQEFHRNQVNELMALAQNPQMAVDRLSRSTQQLAQSHPEVSQAVQAKAMQAASFLLSKKPPTIQTQADMIMGKTRPVAKTELATFNRYVKAATEPGSVLDSLANGHVSVEAAETMRTLYPKTVEQLRTKLIHKMADGAELSHKQRLVLSQFFDTPLSSTMEPSFVAQMQQNWADGSTKAATQQAPPQQAVRQAGIAKAQFGTDDQTRSQRLQAG